jgi:hypothetical protein
VASQLAGRTVGVRCQGFWASMLDIGQRTGEVDFPPDRPPDHMFLVRSVCGKLRHFVGAGSHGNLDCLETIDWRRWTVEAGFDGECRAGGSLDLAPRTAAFPSKAPPAIPRS